MSNVTSLDALREHIVVSTPDAVHVVPALWFERFVSGEVSITSLDGYEEIMRTVVACWVESLRKRH